ncbi:MAG: hypothetical protein GX575_29630 [Candidatus Anammoximicrobium sp.]|nr:hypothetical protein [Candidatus Anammoximicrobium sp.]
MTIEFWPRRLLKPKPKPPPRPRLPRPRRPKLPIGVGKAHQMLSAAMLLGDHELASWLDLAVIRHGVAGKPEHLEEFKKRLDAVMEPLPDPPPPTTPAPSPDGHPATGAFCVS